MDAGDFDKELPKEEYAGKLFLVSTPIGNLEDITLRALRVLRNVDLIAAEDTRHTRQLLSHFDIHVPLESFHIFNEHGKVASLVAKLQAGTSIALVSDAGTPSVADPGYLMARSAVDAGIEPVVIPGVSAVTFAVTASALPVDKFSFLGFVPVKSGRKHSFLESVRDGDGTVFFFESPFRIERTLAELAEVVGPDRPVAVIREATKIHEEIIRGTAGELAALRRQWKGEFVVAVGPMKRGRQEDAEEN
ncbi:MAG: 16S rRNA (cytidine(1402)-2'-O)-methyltransferase [Victivallaceae bacterium]|nr:16S rRNA (cytidine(1402)-2'-O)-methyltransferase [Victivallaceae bacterium]